MAERNILYYVVPTSDFHQTESVGSYFKAREYMSGFTGSEGILVVGLEDAALWVDGRYYIQAAKQLQGSGIIKMESGQPDTPSIYDYIEANMKPGGNIGFDGRVINVDMAEGFLEIATIFDGEVLCEEDLVDMVWAERPELPKDKAWHLDIQRSGQSTLDKVTKLKEYMNENGMDGYIISTLDDAAWLTNMRGNDVEFFPVVLSYVVMEQGKLNLFMDESKLDEELKKDFAENEFVIHPYGEVFDFVKNMKAKRIGLNRSALNYRIFQSIDAETEIVNEVSPTVLWKAIKNPVELKNNRNAHIKEAVALTKFIYWLKTNIGKEDISEYDACLKLLEFRKEQEGFIENSFETIGAYNSNAAMMHYHPTADDYAQLKAEGMFLVDSGGHYRDGTTDTTRTVILGDITAEQKKHFSSVVKAMVRLSKANFLYGCNGKNLDILSRGVIWDLGIDYRCGTGHGVGYLLNIHEDPIGIRWRKVEGINDMSVMEEGMTTSNEPGIYIEGKYGIRIENELVVRKGESNEYGQFMNFETITFVPIDKDGIDKKYLTEDETAWLNEYHSQVYEKLSSYMDEDELKWLKEATSAI